jgi:hypothetical protein
MEIIFWEARLSFFIESNGVHRKKVEAKQENPLGNCNYRPIAVICK